MKMMVYFLEQKKYFLKKIIIILINILFVWVCLKRERTFVEIYRFIYARIQDDSKCPLQQFHDINIQTRVIY